MNPFGVKLKKISKKPDEGAVGHGFWGPKHEGAPKGEGGFAGDGGGENEEGVKDADESAQPSSAARPGALEAAAGESGVGETRVREPKVVDDQGQDAVSTAEEGLMEEDLMDEGEVTDTTSDEHTRADAAATERARIVEEGLHADGLRDREERRAGVCAAMEGAGASAAAIELDQGRDGEMAITSAIPTAADTADNTDTAAVVATPHLDVRALQDEIVADQTVPETLQDLTVPETQQDQTVPETLQDSVQDLIAPGHLCAQRLSVIHTHTHTHTHIRTETVCDVCVCVCVSVCACAHNHTYTHESRPRGPARKGS